MEDLVVARRSHLLASGLGKDSASANGGMVLADCPGMNFGPLLAAQRDYLERCASRLKFGLMVPEAFVRGIRDIGYRSNGEAVAELIDNALQAAAERIDVLFGYEAASTKKPTQLAVVDNGHGMDRAMIRMAVMWGGTHRENDRSGLGRYGYGLPCSCVSLGRRFKVFSRVAGEALFAVELDLDAIAAGRYTDGAGDIVVPEAYPADFPPFVEQHIASVYPEGFISGTVVVVDKLDRLEWTTSQGLRENFCRQFGVTYHKLRGEAALFVDGTFVNPIDPLFLTPGFHLHDLDEDCAQPFDPIRVEVRDPETGAYIGAVMLRYAWLPPSFGSMDKDRDAVGLNANARFSILKDFHGVIFSRNGRLIDVQTRTPWTTFINNDRYIKVEVEFSATLDEAFGVTTSKQQVTVSTLIWELLRQAGLPKAIEQLRNKVKEAKAVRRITALSPEGGRERASEQAMIVAGGVGHGRAVAPCGTAFRHSAYKLNVEHRADEPFFKVSRLHGARTLHLNSAHRFYDDLYDSPTITPEVRAALEVMLLSLADVMLDDGDHTRAQQIMVCTWSRRLDMALAALSERLGQADAEDEEWFDGSCVA